MLLTSLSLFACGGKKHEVKFFDGDTVLKTVKVADGAKAESYTPEKAGYEFLGWYATPALKVAFDFSKPITAATSIFASFKSTAYVADAREFIIAGTSNYRGAPLQANSWGKVTGAQRAPYVFAKSATSNAYTLTVNLYEGDEFQIACVDASDTVNFPWSSQHGFGYVAGGGTEWSNAGGVFATNPNTSNIKVETGGNYTVTMTTEVGNDSLDKITYVRNGDAPAAMLDVRPSIAGTVTGGQPKGTEAALAGTEWELIETPTANVFETTINFNKGDYFAVLLYLNSWTNQQRYGSLTENGKAFAVASSSATSNITLNQSGKYKVTFTLIPGVIGGAADGGTVDLARLGDFDTAFKAPYNTYTFDYTAAADQIIYVKKGARIPAQADDTHTVPADNAFVGWYTDGAKTVPLSTTENVTTDGASVTVYPKFITDTDTDSRDVYLSGSFGVKSGAGMPSHNWQPSDPDTQMTKSGHVYTYVLKVTDAAEYGAAGELISAAKNSEFMFRFYEGSVHTGFTLNGGSPWNKTYTASEGKSETHHVSGVQNVKVEESGWYTIKVDTFTKSLTFVYSATNP
jgi:hypothetical protein